MRVILTFLVSSMVLFALELKAQALQLAIPLPVSHPATVDDIARTAGTWRGTLGSWGEGFVREELTLRGFEVYEPKLHGNKGIDIIAVKRNALGVIEDIRIVEVKTRNGYGKPKLGATNNGKQMSRAWLDEKLRLMKASGDPKLKMLAQDIRKFRERTGIAIEKLGEVHEVNPRRGKIVVRNPITGAEISNLNIGNTLRTLSTRAKSPKVRRWAADQLKSLESIRNTRMTTFLEPSAAYTKQVYAQIYRRTSNASRALLGKNMHASKVAKLAPRVIGRAAGPVGVAIGLYMDANELNEVLKKYQSGNITRSELYVQLSQTGGGMGGAAAGFATGAALGAAFSSWAGPGAGIGAFIGGGIGAGIGYWAGSNLAGGAAQLYIDLGYAAREYNLDQWLQETTYTDAMRWKAEVYSQ